MTITVTNIASQVRVTGSNPVGVYKALRDRIEWINQLNKLKNSKKMTKILRN